MSNQNIFHLNTFNLVNVPPDGNCLFNSIVLSTHSIYGNGFTWKTLRNTCASFVVNNPDFKLENYSITDLLKWNDYNFGINEYASKIVSPTSWGSDLEIILLTQVFKFTIHVYILSTDHNNYVLISTHGNKENLVVRDSLISGSDPQTSNLNPHLIHIHVLLHNQHYQALIPNVREKTNFDPRRLKNDDYPNYREMFCDINRLIDSSSAFRFFSRRSENDNILLTHSNLSDHGQNTISSKTSFQYNNHYLSQHVLTEKQLFSLSLIKTRLDDLRVKAIQKLKYIYIHRVTDINFISHLNELLHNLHSEINSIDKDFNSIL